MAEKKTENPKEQDTEQAAELQAVKIRTTGAVQFWRAGERFGRTARRITDYTPEQLAVWQAEPFLIVEFD